MGATAAARQFLRWTLKTTAAAPLFSQHGRFYLKPRCVTYGLFRSSTSQTPLQSAQSVCKVSPVSVKPVTELPLRSLIDTGFTEDQAEHIQEVVSKVRGRSPGKHALSALTALLALGLNHSSVQKLLQKCPDVCTVKESLLQQRIGNLRKLGLVEGSLQRVVAYYPQILMVPVKQVKCVVAFLKEKCLFTAQQVTDIIRDSPAVVQEDLGEIEYKFQYVYFRMGVKQPEMIKSQLFRFTLDEVRCRHSFLERRGLYQTPDKKGQTTIINPKLYSILKDDQDTFITAVAKATHEEYEVFQRLMAREWQEQELYGSLEVVREDFEDEEDDEEDEETESKSGYEKRKQR